MYAISITLPESVTADNIDEVVSGLTLPTGAQVIVSYNNSENFHVDDQGNVAKTAPVTDVPSES